MEMAESENLKSEHIDSLVFVYIIIYLSKPLFSVVYKPLFSIANETLTIAPD